MHNLTDYVDLWIPVVFPSGALLIPSSSVTSHHFLPHFLASILSVRKLSHPLPHLTLPLCLCLGTTLEASGILGTGTLLVYYCFLTKSSIMMPIISFTNHSFSRAIFASYSLSPEYFEAHDQTRWLVIQGKPNYLIYNKDV